MSCPSIKLPPTFKEDRAVLESARGVCLSAALREQVDHHLEYMTFIDDSQQRIAVMTGKGFRVLCWKGFLQSYIEERPKMEETMKKINESLKL